MAAAENILNASTVNVFFDTDSLVMAVLLFDIFAIAAFFIRRNKKLTKYSVFPLIFCLLLALARAFLPFSPFKPYLIVIKDGILPWNSMRSAFMDFWNTPLFELPFFDAPFRVSHAVCAAALAVTVAILVRCVLKYVKTARLMKTLEKTRDAQTEELLFSLDEKSRKKGVRIYRSPLVGTPIVFGIRKPEIVLPDNEFTNDELCAIVFHEWCHFKNNDMLVKLCVDVVCACMWWNPLVYPWRKTITLAMEMRLDYNALVNRTADEARAYVSSLAKTVDIDVKHPDNTIAFSDGGLNERLEAMTHYKRDVRRARLINTSLAVCALFLFMLSFTVQITFEGNSKRGQYDIQNEEAPGVAFCPELQWICLDDDGVYTLYLDYVPYVISEESALSVANNSLLPIPIVTVEEHEALMQAREENGD